MSQSESDDLSQLDDFELVEERRRVMLALARLTDKCRRLNAEMTKRETLRWMVAVTVDENLELSLQRSGEYREEMAR